MTLESINGLAVLVSAVSAFMLGGIWYGPVFGKKWQHLAGVSDDEIQNGHAPLIFGGAFVLNLIMACGLAVLLALLEVASLFAGALAGLGLGLTFIATSIGINYLFARKTLGLWLIECGYMVVLMTLMGAIMGAWN